MRFLICIAFLAFLSVVVGQYQTERCPTICPLNYSPICARIESYRTFSNECELNVYNCQNRGGARPIRRGQC
ncbi:unnamed protein product [Hermetia illucens]|uniref:Kazal-like domain-containing protein n=1 Tax=Hermetia illucens TaxID=343691 RepID=A0A7R8UK33_HERIL|nr:vasotab-like [Hermetia illucens]CAD7081987.1 unnamed protein product [Hermetia illucens]